MADFVAGQIREVNNENDQVGKVMSDLEGVEIYRGPSEAPIKYQTTGSACGVLLLWTRV